MKMYKKDNGIALSFLEIGVIIVEMKIGKVPETILKRSVFKQIRHRRNEVLVRPGVGRDCSVIGLLPDEVMVMSTDPITGTAHDIGTLAVHITINDIASGGAEPIGVMLAMILPVGTQEEQLRAMMQEIEGACEELDIEILGGHTEVAAAVNQPIVTVTGIGKMKRDEIITAEGLKPSQELVMTKWAGLEGTAILARDKKEKLLTRFSENFIEKAAAMLSGISVVKEARIGRMVGVTAMHDVTEGGIFGALWELGSASDVGLEVDLKKIPIRQETIEICEFFDLNPYMLISSGCLLMATDHGNELAETLRRQGIESAVIGRVTEGRDRIIINGEEKRYLEPPKPDELYRAYD